MARRIYKVERSCSFHLVSLETFDCKMNATKDIILITGGTSFAPNATVVASRIVD